MTQADLILIIASYVGASLFLFLGYWRGGGAWNDKFGIPREEADKLLSFLTFGLWKERHVERDIDIDDNALQKKLSGKWGEYIIMTLAAIGVLIIDTVTPNTSIYTLISDNIVMTVIIVFIVIVLIFIHSTNVIKRNKIKCPDSDKLYINELKNGYLLYNFYTTIIYTLGIYLILMVVCEYMYDKQKIHVLSQDLSLLIKESKNYIHQDIVLQSYNEGIYSKVLTAFIDTKTQLTPGIYIIALILSLNYLVSRTPIRYAFDDFAELISRYFIIPILIVLFYSIYTYFYSFSSMVKLAITCIENQHMPYDSIPWEILQRKTEITTSLRDKQNIWGFFSMFYNTGGLTAIATGLLEIASRLRVQKS